MRTVTFIQAMVVTIAVFIGAPVSADPEGEANKLFVEASLILREYQALPQDDPSQYAERLDTLRQVADKLSKILEE